MPELNVKKWERRKKMKSETEKNEKKKCEIQGTIEIRNIIKHIWS